MKKITFGDNKNIIGKNLKSIRKERHLTQGELAAKMQTFNVNIDQQMISKIENNARIVTDYELASLWYILGVDIKEMLQNIDELPPIPRPSSSDPGVGGQIFPGTPNNTAKKK